MKAEKEEVPSEGEGKGRLVTFYSFKGGVGRSMAVANIATLLARDFGKKVVVVDWDLEAPGIHRFFGMTNDRLKTGLIDYVTRYKELLRDAKTKPTAADIDVTPLLMEVSHFPSGGNVRLLPAGDQTDRRLYAERVNQFDWANFYKEWNGGQFIDFLRIQLKNAADVVLLDSRTGLTDIGGICTLQMPDIVVLVFSFNDQNVEGVEGIARDLSGANPFLSQVKRRPEILLLPSRKDLAQLGELRAWERKAAALLGKYITTTRVPDGLRDPLTYIREVAVPYVPWFTYGEDLAATTDKGYELMRSYGMIATWLIGSSAATGLASNTMESHSAGVNGVAVTPDGRRTVLSSDDKPRKVWPPRWLYPVLCVLASALGLGIYHVLSKSSPHSPPQNVVPALTPPVRVPAAAPNLGTIAPAESIETGATGETLDKGSVATEKRKRSGKGDRTVAQGPTEAAPSAKNEEIVAEPAVAPPMQPMPGKKGGSIDDLLNEVGTTKGSGQATRRAAALQDQFFELAKLYRQALTVSPRDKDPQRWARIQNNLGDVLSHLGGLTAGQKGKDLLVQAMVAYRQTLQVYTRDQLPYFWARTQNSVGNVLSLLVDDRTAGQKGDDLLDQAEEAYQQALQVYTRDKYPKDWAMTQNNLGNVLRNQGRRTDGQKGDDLLGQAVEAYKRALQVRTREQLPQDWAMTQNNLDAVLKIVQERTAEHGRRTQ